MPQFKWMGVLCLAVTVTLFSTLEVVSKTISGQVNPFQITFLRFFAGGLALLLFGLFVKNRRRIERNDLPKLFGVGVLGISVSMSLLQYAVSIDGAKASIVAVAFSCNPVFVFLFQSLLKRVRLRGHQIAGLILCIAGLVCIFLGEFAGGMGSMLSFFTALLASVLYGLYTVLGRDLSLKYGSLRFNACTFLSGALAMLPLMLAARTPVFSFPLTALPQMIYLALFVTGLAYFTYFQGLKVMGAGKGAMVFFLKPVLATLFSILLLSEQAGFNFFAGVGLVLVGVLAVNRTPSEQT